MEYEFHVKWLNAQDDDEVFRLHGQLKDMAIIAAEISRTRYVRSVEVFRAESVIRVIYIYAEP